VCRGICSSDADVARGIDDQGVDAQVHPQMQLVAVSGIEVRVVRADEELTLQSTGRVKHLQSRISRTVGGSEIDPLTAWSGDVQTGGGRARPDADIAGRIVRVSSVDHPGPDRGHGPRKPATAIRCEDVSVRAVSRREHVSGVTRSSRYLEAHVA